MPAMAVGRASGSTPRWRWGPPCSTAASISKFSGGEVTDGIGSHEVESLLEDPLLIPPPCGGGRGWGGRGGFGGRGGVGGFLPPPRKGGGGGGGVTTRS